MIIVNRLSIVQIVIIFTWIRALSFNWTSFCTLWLVLGKTVKCKHCILAISLLPSIEKGCNHSFEQTWIPFQQALVDIGCMARENNFKCCECFFNIISPWKKACRFIYTDYNSHQQKMLWDKIGWNWSSGFGEDF